MTVHLPSITTITAARVLAKPGLEATRGPGSITIEDGVIRRITDLSTGLAEASGRDELVMPALGNGHDHGRGVKFTAFGVADAPLEAWVPAFYARPDIDPYLNSLLIMAHFAQSGIGSALHCHQTPKRAADFEPEIGAAARAAEQIGIRLGLVVPMRDRNRLCYGSDEALLSLLPHDERGEIAANYLYTAIPPKEQVERVERLAALHDSALVQVQFGPVGVQWASDELLERIAEASHRSGRRVHMHFLESKYQREWMDVTYPQGVVKFLDEIGLLSPRLSVAHGVWLRPEELELFAERGVIVSLNTSSNLRLGSGIAPAREMIAKGVQVALGLDGLALDDDDDAIREMRLTDVIHRGPGFVQGLGRDALFRASMAVAPKAVTGRDDFGALAPGMAADIVTLAYGRMTADVIEGLLDPSELILARGTARSVRSLVVAGRQVLADGRVLGVSVGELERELAARIKSQKDSVSAQHRMVGHYQDAIRRYYLGRRHLLSSGDANPECPCRGEMLGDQTRRR
jgi:cytosine/adenosine deaminase-related metal-dependent hydrolase